MSSKDSVTPEEVECSHEKCVKKLNFVKARDNIKGIIKETPLIYSDIFSQESGNKIYLKPENLQRTGAFKIRGAYNKISKLTADQRATGVIASSAGNHAQGVALASNLLGVKATIVMPKTTPLIKVQATRDFGAEVVLFGDCYDEAYDEACRLQKEKNIIFIHPFDDIDVIEGQGTISLEILEELADTDYILVPVGGGGLISGIALCAKAINPKIKIVGIEPEGAMAMKESVKRNQVIKLNFVDTIADGVAVMKPGDLTFEIIKDCVDEIVTVSDKEIMEAFLLLLERHKLVAENAGILSLAGLKKLNVWNKKVVCLISGGNIDVVTVSTLINKGLVSRGRLFCFSVELPDKPGELLKISSLLSKLNANVIGLEHNQFKNTDRFMNVSLEVTCETNGHEHVAQVIEGLNKIGYEVEKVY